MIKGRNAQGKSSVLDAIMAALAGKKGSKELVRPIRDGEERARVALELDDLVVERKWTKTGSTVTVSPKGSNARLNSPQAVLDKLLGALSFDPLEFAEADPKSQVETLIDLIGREQFDLIAVQRKEAYDMRTGVNRDVKSLRSRLEALPDGVEGERLDAGAIADELDIARRKAYLLEEYNRFKARMDEIVAEGQALPNTRTPEVLVDLLTTADEHNKAIDRHEQGVAIKADLAEAEREVEALTGQIQASDNARQTLIARADLPVEGLSFDDERVTFNGVPFQQASSAERLKVSVAMAMALNPDLRVITIRDASLLDDDSKRALVDMATEHDYQIWYEVVGKAGDLGVVIEDGEVEA